MNVVSVSGDFKHVEGEGYYLEGQGEIVLQFDTQGHAKIDHILIESADSGDVATDVTEPMEFLESFTEGDLFEYEIDLNRFKDITSLSVDDDPENENGLLFTQSVIAEQRITFLFSDNQTLWKGYDPLTDSWVENHEMQKEDVLNLEPEQYAQMFTNRIHQKELYVKVIGYSQNPNDVFFTNMEVVFAENEAPVIIEPRINPEEAHDEYVTLEAQLVDLEGSPLEYRILIQKAGEYVFNVIEDWTQRDWKTTLYKAYNYEYFNTGENLIRLEVRDVHGLVSEWTGNIVILNTVPYLVYTYNDFGATGTIYDDDGDDVTYAIHINDQVYQDFLPLEPSPRSFSVQFDSTNVKINQSNLIKITVKDRLNDIAEEEFEIIGQYNGLMFIDERGNYYTTDKGDLLQMLDMGILVAGQNTDAKKVTLKNFSNNTIENVTIFGEKDGLPDIASIKLDLKNDPFEPKDKLVLSRLMKHGEEIDFYVAIHSNKGKGRLGSIFKIHANASIVRGQEEELVES